MNKVEIRNYFQECGILNKKFGRNFNWKTVLENNKQYLDLFDNYKQNYRSEDEAWFCLSKNIEPPLCQVCGENLCKLGEKKYNTVCTECSANKSKNKLIKYQNSINKRTAEDKKNILNKRKKTCLEKYGEENYQCFGSKSFRKKMFDKYGSEFYNNKEKAKHTVQINKLTEDADKVYFVYKHINKVNGKVYIGITKQKPEERWGNNGCNYKQSVFLYSAIKKYGWSNFDHLILEQNLTKKEACEKEIELIAKYESNNREFGYNLSSGGTAPSLSEETKKKISKALKGNRNNLGRKVSEETRRKISDAQIGKIVSEETKKKQSEIAKKRKHKSCSNETKKKISEKHNKKKIICLETNEVFDSIQECRRKTGIEATSICAVCKGKHKTAKGYSFKYLEEMNNEN